MITPTFLRPVDRLYFGPPRGQSAGEIHGGRSEFPPSPHTVAGILRTHVLRDAERRGLLAYALSDPSRAAVDARVALVGERDRLAEGWRLGPTLPAQRTEVGPLMPWLPTPRCLAWPATGDPVFPRPVRWLGDGQPAFFADDAASRHSWFAPPPGRLREDAPRWLSAADLLAVLNKGIPSGLGERSGLLPPFVHREPWVGLSVEDATRRAKDGLLYTLNMLRFAHGSGLVTWAEVPRRDGLDPDALSRGVARAGSKGHLVHFEEAAIDAAWADLQQPPALDEAPVGAASSATETHALLYLATPARMPDYRNPAPTLRPAAPAALTVTVLAAFVDEPMCIGGLDSVSMTPQDNRQHVAPGSCWFVSVSGGTSAERAAWLRSLHATHTLAEPDAAAFGYGLTLVGRLPPAVFEGEPRARH
jgi:CRISPR type III-B/RAMP module-associated protein Cmr3